MSYKTDTQALDFLFELLKTSSPSGYENEASSLYTEYIRPYCDSVECDAIGNITGILNGENPHKILLSAHIDEVGLQITGIKPNGTLSFRPIGGIDILSLYGHEVTILSRQEKVTGIIGGDKSKMNADCNGNTSVRYSDLWIDIGTDSDEESSRLVDVCDFVTYKNNVSLLNNRICSKSLDNKIGVFIISQVIRSISKDYLPGSLYAAVTVQEEIGTKGMAIVAQRIKPDLGFIVDVGHVDYTNEKHSSKLHLGKGIGLIKNADNHPGLLEWSRAVAEDNHLPTQLVAGNNITGGTDSSRLQLFGENTKVIDISIPCKYMHSHNEMVDLTDVEKSINLIINILKRKDINSIV